MANINMSESSAAALQAVNQYTMGMASGYVIDRVCSLIPYTSEELGKRLARQLLQTVANGVLINFLLKHIHEGAPRNYRDPSGGYMLVVGLMEGQPDYMDNSKGLVKGLTAYGMSLLRDALPAERPDDENT